MIELSSVKIQEVKGSFFAYLPKVWAKKMNLRKGSEISWSIEEGDHESLILKIKEVKDVQ